MKSCLQELLLLDDKSSGISWMSSLMSDDSFDLSSPFKDSSGDVSSITSFFTTSKSVLDGKLDELESDCGEILSGGVGLLPVIY